MILLATNLGATAFEFGAVNCQKKRGIFIRVLLLHKHARTHARTHTHLYGGNRGGDGTVLLGGLICT